MIHSRRTARQDRFLLAALVFWGSLLSASPLTAQFTVSPAEIILVPGATPAASFIVENDGRLPVQATALLNDWDRNDDGENVFEPIGTSVGSCGDRVKVFPTTLRIEAGARQTVRVSLEGDHFPSPCWTIVMVQNAPRPMPGQSRVVYISQIGVKVYVLPAGLHADAEIAGFALEKRHQTSGGAAVDTTQDELALRVHNTGGFQVHFEGRVEIRDLQNQVVSTIRIEDFPVLPGASRRLGIALPSLAPGKYVALAVLGYGGDDDIAAQLELEIH